MRRVKFAAAAVLIAGCGAVGVWGSDYLLARTGDGGAAGGGGDRAPTRVTTASPETRTVADAVTAVGTLVPVRSVDLRPLSAGRVETVPVSSGEAIAAGDPILTLDARASTARVAEAEADRDAARQELARIERLRADNVAAEARLEEARAADARTAAILDAALIDLDDRRLTAPFDGTLGIVATDPGDYVTPETVIARFSDLTALEVAFDVPEDYFARVSPGQTVTLETPAYPDRTFSATVDVRTPEVDAATRSFEVRARLPNPDGDLVGGMFVQANLVFDRQEALTVPDDAIISEGAASYVFTVADGTARRTDISLGEGLGDRTIVSDGLNRDDRIVITGWDRLRDGAPVEVADTEPEGALN